MPLYRYNNSSFVDTIEIRPAVEVGLDAAIVLKPSASQADIDSLMDQLGTRNLPVMKDMSDGKRVLQVRGIKDEKQLFSISDKIDPLVNTAAREKIPEDDAGKDSFAERIRKKSLLIPALFYDLGNIAFIVSGIQRGRHNPGGKFTASDVAEMGVGAAFGLGDVLMTAYGEQKGSDELSAASEGLRKYLKEKGITIPEGDRLNPDTIYKSGLVKATNNWMHKNIIFVRTLAEAVGGLSMVASALKPGNRNNQKLAAGLFLTTGWLATFLLEKPRGHKIFDVQPEGNRSMIDKIKDNPRAYLASPSSIANNFLNFAGALKEKEAWKDHPQKKNDYAYNMFSTGAFLLGNIFFGLSGRGRPSETEDDKAITRDLILMAANTLAGQPDLAKKAIDEAAEYIATKLAHVDLSKEEVSKVLTDKIAELQKGSWVARSQPSSGTNAIG